jgi:hypothetical protein
MLYTEHFVLHEFTPEEWNTSMNIFPAQAIHFNFQQKTEVIELDTKVSKHTNDIIQKYASGLFRNATLEFYGIKIPKIKELINVELPILEVGASSMDFIFLLEDDSYLHFEFQTAYNKNDLIRFAYYDVRLFERDGRPVTTVIIYSANVKRADTKLTVGSLTYNPGKIMMIDYDGNAIYMELQAKILDGKALDDVDMLKLIFLPLMKNDIPKDELAVQSLKLAQTIPDTAKRNACIAAAFAFGSKYLDGDKMESLLEVIRMTDLAVIFRQEGREEGWKESKIEIAKNALQAGVNVELVAEITGLSVAVIEKLQTETSNFDV